jgi:two-component system sensor histidine kinase GlrK
MRLSIFTRLIASYLSLFVMLAGVSAFSVVQLDGFHQVIQSIIQNDTAVVELSGQLSDTLLSETRFVRKYVLVKDEQLYKNYRLASEEFSKLINQARIGAVSGETARILRAIEAKHQVFSRLVEEERVLIKRAEPYPAARYDEEIKKAANEIIEYLQLTRQAGEKEIFVKIGRLGEITDWAGRVVIMITAITLAGGLIGAILIAKSITGPLNVIKVRTREIAKGNFQGDLTVKSPPAIRELAEAINTMCHKLAAVDSIKSDFFSHMSHELRTPLASIKEGTNLLVNGLGGEVTDKQRKILTIIGEESERMINLTNSLLDLSKMEAGMLAYHYVETDFASLISDSLKVLLPMAEAKEITIINNAKGLPPLMIDREKMFHVFRNLIGNAIKFTGKRGEITLTGEVKDGAILITVGDTGIGIPQADLERIFLKFHQVIPPKGEKSTGTGLGLATVKQIILAHGGQVWATSQEGHGSIFHISLPLAA